MGRPSRPWFRLYVEAVTDLKLRRLTPAQRWLWVAVLAAARQSPIAGTLMLSEREPLTVADLAEFAGMAGKDVERALPLFERAGLVAWDDQLGAWAVPKWAERQFESDDITQRTRRHRSNHPDRNSDGTFQPRSRERSEADGTTFPGTMTEAEADTDLKQATRDTHDPPPEHAAAAADTMIDQALAVIVERRLVANNGRITNPDGYRRTMPARLRSDHAATIAALNPAAFPTPEALADHLEPPPPPRPPDPLERSAAAADTMRRQQHARRDRPCPTCHGDRLVDNSDGMTACPTCNGTGTANAARQPAKEAHP